MQKFMGMCLGVVFVALSIGCGGSDDNTNNATNVAQLEGQLEQLRGRIGEVHKGKMRIHALVKDKQGKFSKIPAKFNHDGTFEFDKLPPGSKTIIADLDGKIITLKFPKNSRPNSPDTDLIPEEPFIVDETFGVRYVSVQLLADGLEWQTHHVSFDLGTISLSADGHKLVSEHNPLEASDEDHDGKPDYYDTDIDGDGIDNEVDSDPWGKDYVGWSWGKEADSEFDSDGDGIPDWEDPDTSADDPYTDNGKEALCAVDDYACQDVIYCQEMPDDPLCKDVVQPDCTANPDAPGCYHKVSCDPAVDNCEDACLSATDFTVCCMMYPKVSSCVHDACLQTSDMQTCCMMHPESELCLPK
jgi:hypothetical protein